MTRCVLLRFLGVVPLRVGIVILTGVYIMLAYLLWMVNCPGEYALIGTTFLILIAWIIAFVGAFNSSRKTIRYALITWTVFILIWITLTFHRVLSHNKNFCVANKMRCPPSMWLFELPEIYLVSSMANNNEDTTIKTEREEEEEEEEEDGDDEKKTTIETSKSPITKRGPRRRNQMNNVKPLRFSKAVMTISTTKLQPGHFKRNYKKNGKNRNRADSEFVTSRSDATDDSFADHEASNVLTTIVRLTNTTITTKTDTPQKAFDYESTTPVPSADGDYDSYDAEPVAWRDLETIKTLTKADESKFVISITFFLPLFLYSWLALISYYVELKCMAECTCEPNV